MGLRASYCAMVLQVKRAAVRDNSLGLAPEQVKKIEADLRQLSKS